jgi:hypothetical protein
LRGSFEVLPTLKTRWGDGRSVEVSPDAAADGLLEVKTREENGTQVSRFYGDSDAWMKPFMAPSLTGCGS